MTEDVPKDPTTIHETTSPINETALILFSLILFRKILTNEHKTYLQPNNKPNNSVHLDQPVLEWHFVVNWVPDSGEDVTQAVLQVFL